MCVPNPDRGIYIRIYSGGSCFFLLKGLNGIYVIYLSISHFPNIRASFNAAVATVVSDTTLKNIFSAPPEEVGRKTEMEQLPKNLNVGG